jgi:hypothetical protein
MNIPARKRGRPAKETEAISLELLPLQQRWLEDLVSQGCYGNTKEMILLSWINERFRQLLDNNLLTPVAAKDERNIVRMDETQPTSAVLSSQTPEHERSHTPKKA